MEKQEPSSNTTIAFNPPSRLNTIAQGLDQETTYSNQGMVTIKETLTAIQPIEVPAAYQGLPINNKILEVYSNEDTTRGIWVEFV